MKLPRDLERELRYLKTQIEADTEFDYAKRAEIARRARAVVHEARTISRSRPHDLRAQEVHSQAVYLDREAVACAYPQGFWEDYERLKARNPAGLTTAVKFLEADPWFFRSGYTKADLIRSIRHFKLPEAIAERLRRVVVAAVDRCDRREFREYCRLARKIDSPVLREALQRRLQGEDLGVRRRARWVLDACEQPG